MAISVQDSLFELPGMGGPSPPRRKRWGGAQSTKARAKIRAMLPAPCHRCGEIISPEDDESTWQAGHEIDRMDTEALGLPESDTLPEHTSCNLKAGGRRGAAITNQKHSKSAQAATARLTHEQRESEPQWW